MEKGQRTQALSTESGAQDDRPDDKGHQRRKAQRDQMGKMNKQIRSAVKQTEKGEATFPDQQFRHKLPALSRAENQ